MLGYGVRCEPGELSALAEEYADLARTADWIADHGGVAYLAHPYWTGVTPGTLALPSSVVGIEVFNAGCELEVGRGLSAVHWDELAEAGRLCPALATDDSHHPGFDSDLAWTWLRVEERTHGGVLDALAKGRFYSTAGPVLADVTRDGDSVEVRCSPCRSVTLVSGKSIGSAVNAGRLGYAYRGARSRQTTMVSRACAARVPPAARHVRVEVTDCGGGRRGRTRLAV